MQGGLGGLFTFLYFTSHQLQDYGIMDHQEAIGSLTYLSRVCMVSENGGLLALFPGSHTPEHEH